MDANEREEERQKNRRWTQISGRDLSQASGGLQIQCEVKPWATQRFGHDGRFVS
jgi:hypothetical protein